MKPVLVIGTADTKAEELGFLANVLRAQYPAVKLVDVSTGSGAVVADLRIDVPATEVAQCHPKGRAAVLGLDDRGQAVAAMGQALARYLALQTDVGGVMGIGGGGGTSIITTGMRDMPFGLPKIMVSTLASGDVAPYVGISDLMMLPAVTDLAGLNRISRTVLHNAAMAMAGMAQRPAPMTGGKPAIGLSMFGVTTPCVMTIAAALRDQFDCLVFHATGTGGRVMEKLADEGLLTALIDMTTTEVVDLLLGGVLPATDDRFGAMARRGLPWVGSVGACDMINFGAYDTVPDHYKTRTLYRHNPQVTLVRTTAEENSRIGAWIAARLNLCSGPVRLLLPEGGVSALDAPGKAFQDPIADSALFAALEAGLQTTDQRRLIRLPCHINDSAFAEAAVTAFRDITA